MEEKPSINEQRYICLKIQTEQEVNILKICTQTLTISGFSGFEENIFFVFLIVCPSCGLANGSKFAAYVVYVYTYSKRPLIIPCIQFTTAREKEEKFRISCRASSTFKSVFLNILMKISYLTL